MRLSLPSKLLEVLVAQLCPTVCDPMDCRLLYPWNSPDKNTGVSCHSLLWGIFLTQGSNQGLLLCRQSLYCLNHQEIPENTFYTYCSFKIIAIIISIARDFSYFSKKKKMLYILSEVAQSCPTLCDPMDFSLPGSSIHGIFQARILEWVAISFSRGTSRPRDWTQVSCIVGRRLTVWVTREAHYISNIWNYFISCISVYFIFFVVSNMHLKTLFLVEI